MLWRLHETKSLIPMETSEENCLCVQNYNTEINDHDIDHDSKELGNLKWKYNIDSWLIKGQW